MNSLRGLWHTLTTPRATDEDEARQEYMTKVILTILTMVAFVLVPLETVLASIKIIPLEHPLIALFTFLLFSGVLWLAYRRYQRLSGYVPVIETFLVGLYLNYTRGIGSTGMCFYIIAILLATMLLGVRAQWGVFVLSFGVYLGIGWAHTRGYLPPPPVPETKFADWIMGVGGTFISITLLLQFFTGQYQLALARSRTFALELGQEIAERERAEEKLRRYRDHLKELVQERTQELEEAQAELVRQERLSALGQLTATVAHEIRNPLSTVRASVFAVGDAIERNAMGQVERALQLAERNIIRCNNIITELLDFTRDRVLQLEPTQIDTWLEMVLDEQSIPQDIVCTRELNAGVQVLIDRENFRRAIVNVIDNAIHALQDEESPGNQLTVGAQVVKGQAGPRLEIQVGDTGCGIPADVLPKVIEPLFSTKSFGVGLGLPIVKNILEQHSGGVEIQSEIGQGTTVVLWMPVDMESQG
jgi:signal transduction histidine kinase